MIRLSLDAVRGLMIEAQGLNYNPQPPAGKDEILAAIRQIHMLQIDSINVVARAPYFVLWSRLGDYKPEWLDELLAEGALFEFWTHAMCLVPIEDYALCLVGSRVIDWQKPQKWIAEHPEVTELVMNRIRDGGEARISDFERSDDLKHDWTNPRDEQRALDMLVHTGDLMVRRRDKFQRVFDLRERVFPASAKLPAVSRSDAHDQFVLNTVKTLGVVKADWISSYYRLKTVDASAALKRLIKQDRLLPVAVEGWTAPGYIHPDHLRRVEAAAANHIPRSATTLLSPFDPLIRDEGRIRELFGFDYTIEFYFPASKRKYGYYSLPILHNNRLIGRLDPKAQRKEGIFEVKALHLEPGVETDDALVTQLRQTLRACALWHQTPQVVIRAASDPDLIDLLSD